MAHFGGDTLANGVLGWQYRCMAWDEGFSSQDHAQEVLYRGADNHYTATCVCSMACL